MTAFEYNARRFIENDRHPDGVIDGDTYILQLDLGFYQWFVETIRLEGIDTHEIHFVSHDSEEYERGMEEKRFVQAWLKEGADADFDNDYDKVWPFEVLIQEYDAYGKYPRVIADVRRKSDGRLISAVLLKEFDNIEY